MTVFEPSSFRDPSARVFKSKDGRIFRCMSESAISVYRELRSSGLLQQLISEESVVDNWETKDVKVPDGWSSLVESQALPFISYPYEWSFDMLKDAALLTLDITESAYNHGFTLKDASAFNIVFSGSKPVFIDISSFDAYQEGEPWIAYSQFCDHFLAPLMLMAYKHIPFHPLFRSNLEGISTTKLLTRVLGRSSLCRPGVIIHVKLRSFFDRMFENSNTESKGKIAQIKISKKAILRNINSIRNTILKLHARESSRWLSYTTDNTYNPQMEREKADFISRSVELIKARFLAWDVGSNTGEYSLILASQFRSVVAIDSDHDVINRLYNSMRGTDAKNITPIVLDFMNPSPSQGFAGTERTAFFERAKPDVAVFFAFIHHICLRNNVPLNAFIDLIAKITPHAIVEFVSEDDPMSRNILALKPTRHEGYNLQNFKNIVSNYGKILIETSLSKTRSLHFITFDQANLI